MALHDDSFRADAACTGRTELFFAPAGSGQPFDPEPARALCRSCPVLEACWRYAEAVGDIRRGRAVHGVIAGLAPDERPIERICAWEGCRALCGDRRTRYCSEEHVRAARAVTSRSYHARQRVS